MALAGFVIFLLEVYKIQRLEIKYFGRLCTPEEFLSRASLDDIIRWGHHIRMMFLALGIMTMGRLFTSSLG